MLKEALAIAAHEQVLQGEALTQLGGEVRMKTRGRGRGGSKNQTKQVVTPTPLLFVSDKFAHLPSVSFVLQELTEEELALLAASAAPQARFVVEADGSYQQRRATGPTT